MRLPECASEIILIDDEENYAPPPIDMMKDVKQQANDMAQLARDMEMQMP